jgi:hypothetical protein
LRRPNPFHEKAGPRQDDSEGRRTKSALFVEEALNKPVGKLSIWDHFIGVQPEIAVHNSCTNAPKEWLLAQEWGIVSEHNQLIPNNSV